MGATIYCLELIETYGQKKFVQNNYIIPVALKIKALQMRTKVALNVLTVQKRRERFVVGSDRHGGMGRNRRAPERSERLLTAPNK